MSSSRSNVNSIGAVGANHAVISARDVIHRGDIKDGLAAIGGNVYVNTLYLGGHRPHSPTDPESKPGQPDSDAVVETESWPDGPPEVVENVPDKPLIRSVAAVYCSQNNFRIYFQKRLTIYEFSYIDDVWTISATIEASDARENTPLAAVSYDCGTKIHIFYITRRNVVREVCWSTERGWRVGSLTAKALAVSPYSSLSATCSNETIYLYCQRGTMICELWHTDFPSKWWYRELEHGLPGTSIASTSYAAEENTVYHVYFQDMGNYLQENIYELQELKESDLTPKEVELPAYTPLTAVSWFADDSSHLRLYLWEDGHIRMLYCDDDEGWEGPVDVPSSEGVEKGSQIAAFEQGDGGLIRIYHVLSGDDLGQISFSEMLEGTPESITLSQNLCQTSLFNGLAST